MNKLILWALIVIPMATFSCKTTNGNRNTTSKVKIVNGVATDDINAVVRLSINNDDWTYCTGSFINKTTMLTAAHCLGRDSPDQNSLTVDGTEPTSKHYLQEAFPRPWLSKGLDLAILKFPAEVSERLGITSFLKIAESEISEGDEITMIGFGMTDHYDQYSNSEARKYSGVNNVSKVEDWKIVVIGATRSDWRKNDASIEKGDSGGPLLNADGDIVGVASMGKIVDDRIAALFVHVPNDGVKDLLEKFIDSEE